MSQEDEGARGFIEQMDREVEGIKIQRHNIETFNRLIAISRGLPPEQFAQVKEAMEKIDGILAQYNVVGFLALGLMASHMTLEMGREVLDAAMGADDDEDANG